MARITPDDVTEILETELQDDSLMAFIEDAHSVVNERIAPYTDDTARLSSVETYLAAHLATSRDPRVQTASHESVSFEYAENQGQTYWHRAIMMDPTGRLARPQGYNIYTTH